MPDRARPAAPPSPSHDLLAGERFDWHLGRNYVRLEPPVRQAHVLASRSVTDVEPPPTGRSQPGHWFEADPLWFKTAVFYEIHLRGFFDGNGDGSGDFRGLTEKLDYLQWLGIDCIWLLPMYASRRCATAATTSPTSTRSTPTTGRSRTSASSSRPPTSAACASSPTSS